MAFQVHEIDLLDEDVVKAALVNESEQAVSEGKVMTIVRLAYTLGLSRQRLSEIINGHRVKFKGVEIPQAITDLIKKAADYCELCVTDAGFAARNPAMAIFVLKAIHQYDDKPQSGANNVTVIISDKNIPD